MRLKRCIALLLVLVAVVGTAFGETVQIPMRDGVKLAADYYLPAEGGPAFPVVVARSVYGRGAGKQLAPNYTKAGIVFVVEDTRGRGDSEGGKDMVFLDDGWGEHQDGLDTVNWIRQQPWCNGKVGSWGGSALGITQVRMAAAGADVQAQSILVAASDFYQQLSYQGGVFHKQLVEKWVTGQKSPHVIDLWKSHPAYDDFWKAFNAEPRAPQVTAPGLHVGGWFDIFGQGTINNFTTRQHNGGKGAKGNQMLVMGPWTHGLGPKIGDVTMKPNSGFTIGEYERRFFEHWLLGKDNGIGTEPAVHYYTVGACDEEGAPGNEWRTADDWPPFETKETAYLLGADGSLGTDAAKVKEGQLGYAYDPKNPCPTLGGANLFPDNGIGPIDQRKLGERADVLKFATTPLDAPVEITGQVKVRLYVSTDAPDTDFTAKLVDIYPDGRELMMLDGIQRLKFRKGYEKAEPLAAGEVGEVEIDLWSISLIVNKGHRIGVQVSSSNYPRFELNPNTGTDFPATETRVAKNTIYAGGNHPSALLLPVR
jgi:predicted acyl esterase